MNKGKSLFNLLILSLVLILPQVIFGRPIIPTLELLTNDADLIIVAHVEEVVEEKPEVQESVEKPSATSSFRRLVIVRDNLRVARATVLDIWKGSSGNTVKFRASKSWTCDISNATTGETVILFLKNEQTTPFMSIAYSGLGRLQVKENSVLLYTHLLTKERINSLGFSEENFSKQLQLASFKQQVQSILAQKNIALDKQFQNALFQEMVDK